MSFLSKLMTLFPLSLFLLLALSIYRLCLAPSFFTIISPLLVIYIYPVLIFRIINIFSPLKEGIFDMKKKGYIPWWGSHMIQTIYFACPWLEGVLRIIPGLYSFWLRLWGAKVGKNIYWTPNIEIDDRPLLEIGDDCIVGHKLHFIPHIITPKRGTLSLYLKKIRIGKSCFLGAGSRLGPGVVLEERTSIPILTDGQINQHFKTGSHFKKK